MSILGNMFGAAVQGSVTPVDHAALQNAMLDSKIAAHLGSVRKEMMHGLFPDSVGKTIFDGRLIVTKVLNGYVIQYGHSSSSPPDVYVESDLDGVNARIKALMTSFNLEHK